MFCKKCGAEIDDDSQFCQVCGKPLESGTKGQSTSSESKIDAIADKIGDKADKVVNDIASAAFGSTAQSALGQLKPFNEQTIRNRLEVEIGDEAKNIPIVYGYSYATPWWGFLGAALLFLLPPVGVVMVIIAAIYIWKKFRHFVIAVSNTKYTTIELSTSYNILSLDNGDNPSKKFDSFSGNKIDIRNHGGQQVKVVIPGQCTGLPEQRTDWKKIRNIVIHH
ncbi:MAG: zinc ribbon domain-containing protein [Deltaproteobacteria bacterium]|nr:zinc ribbon domain-containing protein [Deltaproteobacteria bacterium]